jgi:hypothetical protein
VTANRLYAPITATAVAISAGGTGHAVGDVVTVAGGTFTLASKIKVLTISGGGATGPIVTCSVDTGGAYTVAPTPNPIAQGASTGAGINATFTMTYSAAAAVYRPYGMRFEFPAIFWTRVPDSVQSGGANDVTYAFTAIKGNFSTAGSLPDTITIAGTTAAPSGDFRVIAAVKDTDELSPDTKFSTL